MGSSPMRKAHGDALVDLLFYCLLNTELVKVCVCGGRREKNEQPEQTACREIFEETGNIVRHGKVASFIKKANGEVFVPRGRFIIFILKDRYGLYKTVEREYEKMRYRPVGAEHDKLLWVPVSELYSLNGGSASINVEGQN